MTTVSMKEALDAAYQYGVTDPHALAIAGAIAQAESGLDKDKVSPANSDGSHDHGLWQINDKAHRKWFTNPRFDMTRVSDNAAAMAEISNGGKDWSPWTTYKNGTYQQYLPQSSQVAQQVAKAPPDPLARAERAVQKVKDALNPSDWLSGLSTFLGQSFKVAFVVWLATALALIGVLILINQERLRMGLDVKDVAQGLEKAV